MAYPTVSAPYGLKPINRVDGMPYAGATRQYGVDTGSSAAALFYGDLVILVAGKIQKWVAGTGLRPLGVFVGAQYVNSMGQTVQAQSCPLGVTNPIAYVVVDGQAAFQVVVASMGGTVVDTTTIAAIGANVDFTPGSGNTTTGDSTGYVVSGSEATTANLPLRVIDVVPATATANGFPELIVKINVSQFDDATGVV